MIDFAAEALSESLNKELAAQHILEDFCKRELEVFRLMGQGMMLKQVATALGLADKTVMGYRRRIGEKLQMSTTTKISILSWRLRRYLSATKS